MERSGCNFFVRDLSHLRVAYEALAKKERVEMMQYQFASLIQEGIIHDIITDYARLAKSKTNLTSIGVNKLAAKMLAPKVINNPRFRTQMVKLEQEELIDLRDDPTEIQADEKLKTTRSTQQEFDYQPWVQRNTQYPEVQITKEIRVVACTTLKTFLMEIPY